MKKPLMLGLVAVLSGCLAVEEQVLDKEVVDANHELLTQNYMALECNNLLLQRQSLSAVKRPGMLFIHPAHRAHGQKQLAAAEDAIKRKGC